MSDQRPENENLLDEGAPTAPDASDPNPDISTEEIDPEEIEPEEAVE